MTTKQDKMTFHSFDQFLKYYYPLRWAQDKIKKMSAEEYGGYLAQKAMNKAREHLKGNDHQAR